MKKRNLPLYVSILVAGTLLSTPQATAASGFIPLGTTNDGTTHALTDTISFDVVQNYVTNTTQGSLTASMTAGNAGNILETRVVRTTSWDVSGDDTGSIDISFNTLSWRDLELTTNTPINSDLVTIDGEEANTHYRQQFNVVGNVSEIIITQSYSVGWSPRLSKVWEGMAVLAGANGAHMEMQLFDANSTIINLESDALWLGSTSGEPDSYDSSGTTAIKDAATDGVTETNIHTKGLTGGSLEDDFISSAVFTLTPETGTYFTEGTFFAHTVNGQTVANAPVIPEPTTSLLLILGATSLLKRKRL